MPRYHRHCEPGQLQFITTSTYRRAQLFHSPRFRNLFAEKLGQRRHEMHFLIVGWVLMPEHFHLLIRPEPAEATPVIMKRLKERVAISILRTLRENRHHSWCQKMLDRFRLPATVHDESEYRIWQRRFRPFNVYSRKKVLEKLNYMHNNPVKRGLVQHPGHWPWSSWRFYFLNDASLLTIDRIG